MNRVCLGLILLGFSFRKQEKSKTQSSPIIGYADNYLEDLSRKQ